MHLVDLPLDADVAPVDGPELEVLGHVGVDEHPDELPVAHDELRDHVDVVVAVGAEGLGDLLPGTELLPELKAAGGERRDSGGA